jgi:hypothetical protein
MISKRKLKITQTKDFICNSTLDVTGRKFQFSQIMLPVGLSYLKRGVFSVWPEKTGIAKDNSRLSMVPWGLTLQLVA